MQSLHRHETQLVRVRGQGVFGRKGTLHKIEPVESIEAAVGAPTSERPIWETILEMAAEVPEDEAIKLPRDLAQNVDHYLYGAPRHP